MSQLIIDVFFTTVFILLLVLLAKIRIKAFDNNKDSFRYTFLGLSVLGAASLLQLAGHQNLLDSVPFLTEPVYRELLLGIGIVSGITLMIAGVSIWLPGRKQKAGEIDNSGNSAHALDIEKAIIHSQNLKSLLRRIPKMISRDFNFKACVIFYRQNRLNKYVCTYREGIDETETQSIKNIDFSLIGAKQQAMEIMSRIPHDYCLSVMVNNLTRAILLFRKNSGEAVSEVERRSLKEIGRVLTYRFNNEFIAKKERFYSRCWEYSGHIKNIFAAKNSIGSNLPVLHQLFKQALGAEYFSLTVLGKRHANPKAYTVGINGNILLDGGNSSIMKNSYFRKILADKKAVLIENINEARRQVVDSMFVSCGQCSFLAQPIIVDNRVVAILTLGHSAAYHFGREDLLLVEALAYSLTSAIVAELNQRQIFERDRYLAAINGFESAVRKATDIDSLLKAAADLLINNVSTTMVRITVLDDFRIRLKTAAIKTIRPVADLNTDDSILSRELTYWHQVVAEEGRLLLINQDDAESRMEKSEIESLVFKTVQSALIIPIVINGRTFGMITLGEMRAWERTSYNSTTISFCKTIAAKIADTIKLLQISRMMVSKRDTQGVNVNSKSDTGLLRRLKVPMTNLQGSLEILRIKGSQMDGDANRILSRMEESSNDIVNLLNDY